MLNRPRPDRRTGKDVVTSKKYENEFYINVSGILPPELEILGSKFQYIRPLTLSVIICLKSPCYRAPDGL